MSLVMTARHQLAAAGILTIALTAGACAAPANDADLAKTAKSGTGATSSSPAPSSSTTTATPAVTPEPEPTQGSVDNPAPYGTEFIGGTWAVTVDSVNGTTANAAMQAENQFNESERGQFVLVHVTARNISQATAGPGELSGALSFIGGDLLAYDTAYAVTPDALDESPQALPGGTISGNIVFDVAPEAVGDGIVAGLNSTTGDLTVWSGAAS